MKKQLLLIAFLPLTILSGCGTQTTPINHTMDTMNTMDHMQIHSEQQFIVEMIPHHQEAVNTSQDIHESTNNIELKNITTAIISGQTSEITMMKGWLNSWYSGANMSGNYMNMMPDFSTLTGSIRDKLYIQGMIDHHQGAIDMAQQALKLDLHPEVKKFAQAVISVQSDEINKFNSLLDTIQ